MNLQKFFKDVMAASNALREPLSSEAFNPWPLQSALESIEGALKRRKRGLKELYESGLYELYSG